MARLRPYSSIIGIFFIKRQEWYLQMHFEWVAVFYNWEIAKNILNLQSETNFFNRILLNQVKSAVFYFLYNSNVHVWYFVFRSCAELGYNNNLLLISCSPQKLTASPQKTSIWWPETSREWWCFLSCHYDGAIRGEVELWRPSSVLSRILLNPTAYNRGVFDKVILNTSTWNHETTSISRFNFIGSWSHQFWDRS